MKQNISKFLQNLNSQQKDAVESIEGPILVVAGPGTGKTQVLALRIANILQKTDTKASNILCLTFTESGVGAMRQRLIDMIGNEAYYIRIHTFHSFCNEVIQTFPEKFAFAKELIQLDDLNKLKLIREIIEEFDKRKDDIKLELIPFYDKYYYQSDILSSIQTLKREGVSSDKLKMLSQENLDALENNKEVNKRTGKPKAEWSTNYKSEQKNLELAKIYTEYNNNLLEKGFYDYEDMILFVIREFGQDDELLSYYQEKFLFILVDEYQDTNGAQNELLKLLGNFDPSPNIFAVGDDDQAIYRFQGANVENLLFFEKQFLNVKTIPIVTNYRSSQLILDLSSNFIEHNKARLTNLLTNLNKKLKAGIAIPNNKAQIFNFSTSEVESNFLVEKIKQLHINGVAYSDIAVFYRKHSDSENIVEDLLNADIPLKLAIGKNSLTERIIQQFLNLIRVINFTDKNRDFLLFQVLFYDFINLSRLDIFKLTRLSNDLKTSIFDLMNDKEKLLEGNIIEIDKIYDFAKKIVNWKALSANYSLVQFVQKVAIESNYIDYIFKKPANIEYINSINSFYSYVKELNRQNKKIILAEFLKDIDLLELNKLSISEKELEINKDGVNLMTAHKAKGLEYKHVFIVKFYNGNWGGRSRREVLKLPHELFNLTKNEELNKKLEVDEIEDERRLLFVALTRAKENIYITYAKEYPSGNSTKQVSASIFLNELNQDLIEFPDTDIYESFEEKHIQNILTFKITSPYSIKEKDYLKFVLSKFRLSATSLNEYIECPLKFKFNKLLKVPKEKEKSMLLGTAIHATLENYFRHFKIGEDKDINYVYFVFEKFLERELLGPEDFNPTLVEGKKLLLNYFNHYKNSFSVPVEIEYGFYDRNLILEMPEIEPIPLVGKLDKIEWVNKATNQIRIVDYKTISPKSTNAIKGLTKNSTASIYRQLTFYKLLTECDNFFRPNVNSGKYQVEEVEVDFLKPNPRGIFKKEKFFITNDEVDDLKLKIADVMKRIRNLEFSGSEEYPLCKKCEFCKMIESK